jgi:hypothetical protein
VGTPVTVTQVAGTPVTQNTLVPATADCPATKVLLGGGGHITTNFVQKERVVLVSSHPSSTTTWTAIAVVTASLGNGNSLTITAYAICSL